MLNDLTFSNTPNNELAEPSRAEPSRAEPSRAEPSRAEPSRASSKYKTKRLLLCAFYTGICIFLSYQLVTDIIALWRITSDAALIASHAVSLVFLIASLGIFGWSAFLLFKDRLGFRMKLVGLIYSAVFSFIFLWLAFGGLFFGAVFEVTHGLYLALAALGIVNIVFVCLLGLKRTTRYTY